MKKYLTQAVVLGSALFTTAMVNAADYTAAVGAAQTEAEGNVGAATLAVIGVAVVGFGVAAVIGWMRK
ncbi:hypothetical protein [Paraglaciecola sp.]|uniref:hypothetical protein n=1 Tax=Paraglaciecola sp. TaxID=1920173 RepID=UPI0030F3CD05